jgi:hypothetical protein
MNYNAIHQLLPVQPVNTGWSIVWSHDSYKESLSYIYSSLRWVGYGNVLLSRKYSVLLVVVNVWMIADLFMRTPASMAGSSRKLFFQGFSELDTERVFLVGKLVYQVASITPERELGVGRNGRAALDLLVGRVYQRKRLCSMDGSARGGESVEGDIGRPPRVGREWTNLVGFYG